MQADVKIDSVYTYGPKSGNKPKQIVVLLHGLGADGKDLLSLAPEFAPDLPDAVFISPDAPFPCDMAPYGRQWFSLQDWSFEARLTGIQKTAPILEVFLKEQLKKYDLSADKLALVGFSQGTMMSLYVGPRLKEQIAGIVGYSGALVWEDNIEASSLQKPPVYLTHGEADEVVPIDAYHNANEKLSEFGFDVSGHTTPRLGHGIDGDGLEKAKSFLVRCLAE